MPDSEMFPSPLYRSASGNGSRPLPPVARGSLFALHIKNCCLRFLRGRHKDSKSDLLYALKKNNKKKPSIKLSSLSVRSLSLWRAKTRFAITAACIYSNLWLSLTGQIICRRWFCFSTKKEKQTNKQKTSFCNGPSGLNATPRGKLRKNGKRWRPSGPTVRRVVLPRHPLQTLSAAIFSLRFL